MIPSLTVSQHAYQMVRCPDEYRRGRDGHHAEFRTSIHAIHRRSYDCLGIHAIETWEPYFYDHCMSDAWAHERGEGPLGPNANRVLRPTRYDLRSNVSREANTSQKSGCHYWPR